MWRVIRSRRQTPRVLALGDVSIPRIIISVKVSNVEYARAAEADCNLHLTM